MACAASILFALSSLSLKPPFSSSSVQRFSVRHPVWVLAATAVLALAFASQFPKVTFDNDPENMLAPDAPVRVKHHEVKEQFALYDFVIVGIVNETNPDGVFNVETLQRVDALTAELLSLRRGDDGRVLVTRDGQDHAPALRPTLDTDVSVVPFVDALLRLAGRLKGA